MLHSALEHGFPEQDGWSQDAPGLRGLGPSEAVGHPACQTAREASAGRTSVNRRLVGGALVGELGEV